MATPLVKFYRTIASGVRATQVGIAVENGRMTLDQALAALAATSDPRRAVEQVATALHVDKQAA